MKLINGRMEVFSTNFLVRHGQQALVVANVGLTATNFNFNFRRAEGFPGFEWNQGEGVVNITVRFDPTATWTEQVRLGVASDTAEIFGQIVQQTFGDFSLVHFYIFKAGIPTTPAPSAA